MEQRLLVRSASDNKTGPNRSASISLEDGNQLLIACHGLAGAGDGAAASEAAMDALQRAVSESGQDDPRSCVQAAFEAAHAAVVAVGDGARCSAVVALVSDDACQVAWSGNCHALLVRDKEIVQRTGLHDEGVALGADAFEVGAPEAPWPLVQSDKVILMSHDIAICVEDRLIPSVVAHRPPEEAVFSMMKLAMARGATVEGVLIIGAWQDPSLRTISEDDYRPQLDHDNDDTDKPAPEREEHAPVMLDGTSPIQRATGQADDEPTAPTAASSSGASMLLPIAAALGIGLLLLVGFAGLMILASG